MPKHALVVSLFAVACLGADAPVAWQAAIDQANHESSLGHHHGAEALLRDALKIIERTDPKGAAAAVTWNNLGLVRQSLGDVLQAETCFQRALSLFRKMPAASARELARPLNNLAALYLEEGQPDKVPRLDLPKLAEDLKTVSPNYPDLVITLENIAGYYYLRNRLDEADKRYQEILELRTKQEGPDSTEVAGVMHNIAALRVRQGRMADAEDYLTKCFRIWDANPSFRNPNLVLAHANMGLIYALSGRHEEADRAYERAIAIATARLGPDHRRTGDVVASYAAALRLMKRKKEASRMQAKAREIRLGSKGYDLGATVAFSDLMATPK